MNTFLKPFFVLLALAVALTMGLAYRQFIVERDYPVDGRIPCDPAASCFASDCDPQADLSCLSTPYLKVQMQASIAPSCLEDGDCRQFSCPAGVSVKACAIIPCTADDLEDGEHCTVASSTAL